MTALFTPRSSHPPAANCRFMRGSCRCSRMHSPSKRANRKSGEVDLGVSRVRSPLTKEDCSRLGHANDADGKPASGVAGWLSFQIVDFLMDDQTTADDRVGAVKAEVGVFQFKIDVTA
jgi:hypothetical protein